jgi:RNA polymerase sigma-70 factor (ECF subfamily)
MRATVPMDVLSMLDRPRGSVRALPAASAIDDADLVRRAQQGDRWAEEAIYRRHVNHVAGLVVRLLRSRTDVEDIVQDTFAVALDQIGALRDGRALRAWLSQIAVSQLRRRLRRRRLLRILGLDATVDDATLGALAADSVSAETQAELVRVDRVLGALPVEQRLAWMLRYVEGETLEDVAKACACSLATAKRRVAAAETRIRLHVRLDGGAS